VPEDDAVNVTALDTDLAVEAVPLGDAVDTLEPDGELEALACTVRVPEDDAVNVTALDTDLAVEAVPLGDAVDALEPDGELV
jgi:hypothetical protein